MSGLGLGRYALLTERFDGSLVEVEGHDHGRFLAAVDEDGRLAGEAGARDDLSEDVAGLGDLRAVLSALLAGRGHDHRVADSLPIPRQQTRFLSYDGYDGHERYGP